MDIGGSNKWIEFMRKHEPVLDQMVLAGWATGYSHDKDGITIAFTDLGHERMKCLTKVLDEICKPPLKPNQFGDIWVIVTIYTSKHSP